MLVALGGLLAGCSTMVHGPVQSVRIESSPPGAQATITPQTSQRGPGFVHESEQTVTTPATVDLRRDTNYRVEFQKEGYKIASTRVRSEYNWFLGFTPFCGGFPLNVCEAVGQIPLPDVQERPLPVRFLTAFFTYPVGAIGAVGKSLRLISPEALAGHSFKLQSEDDGYFDQWSGTGTPVVQNTLERLD